MDSAPLTRQQIEDRACELFFPNGKSYFGALENISKVIANPTGEAIVSFPGNGTIADYLSTNGLYPSLTYLYVRTLSFDSGEEEPTLFQNESTSVVEKTDNSVCVDASPSDNHFVTLLSPPSQLLDEDPLPTSIISPETSNAITSPEHRTVCPFCFCTSVPGEVCLCCEQDKEYQASLNVVELELRENTAVVDESSYSETSPLNQEEIRRHRVAYLSRNDSIDSPGFRLQ